MGIRYQRQRSLAIVVGLLAPVLACGEASQTSTAASRPPPRAVQVQVLESEQVATSLRVPGVVEAQARTELAFRVPGFVARFLVDAGDRVTADQVLAELDPAEFERAVRAARAELARTEAHARDAEASFRRQDGLLGRNMTARMAFDTAQSARDMALAERDAARVALEGAEDRLAKAVLRAPVAGVIEARLSEAHQIASEQEPVLVLTQLDRVKVRAAVAAARAAELRVGAKAWVTSPLRPERRFEGHVARIDVAADPATRTLPFELEVANPELALLPALAVDVEVDTGERTSLVLAPLAAVLRDVETQPFVFVVEERSGELYALRRKVDLGAILGQRVTLTAGIEPGERLVVRGQHFLRPGDPVRVVEAE